VASALAVAIDPSNANHVLVGTDTGLLATRNGGLDWDGIAPEVLAGPVFAVAFDVRGTHQLAATAYGLLASSDGLQWRLEPMPPGATPARQLVPGGVAGRVYLVGWHGLFRSENWGAEWTAIDAGLPDAPIRSLVIRPDSPRTLLAVADGQVWQSDDGGSSWEQRSIGLPAGQMQALAINPRGGVVWVAGADRVFRHAPGEAAWQPFGAAFPEHDTDVRGIAPGPGDAALVLSTHRGLYATIDYGATWNLLLDNLPGHLEAGPLLADPTRPTTLYAAFSLMPYDEAWARAADSPSATGQLTVGDLFGALAFLALLFVISGAGLRLLARQRGDMHQEAT
jgi:photosystem II stability/assembly factor-like uncharacterized protein